ncbi:MAG TPA: DNA repair protein RecO, partial [Gammaproteobacteria bacterium]|nr:DNA repair protein RecO [Gammaproteobacteria bacterium]
ETPESVRFFGANLLALKDLNFKEAGVLSSAKRLLRIALAVHLGDKPLHSRSLFKQRT